ncbi:GNAT family N-acetyltransferase [Burkholderia cenocepacia]|uniref:GNAT family N-acetyltransferase n=1 Tax=Burkholderia cenocepacia TaxID=95486 RepID=UPI002656D77A|nr:GNAT family N-acetyltransferase [Burkholderia cenocepacia]MDN7541949.1 PLxRFG domain-containing protein [Burkholderia cenocepacia]
MADFDPSTATLAPGEFDPSTAVPYTPAPRGALGEIGAGLARGALVDLPTLGGQAVKFVGGMVQSPTMQAAGGAATQFGDRMAQKNWLQLHPEQHGAVVNALAAGAEQVAPVAAVPLAVGGALAAAPVEIPAAATALIGAAAGGALFGAASGQSTLEKAQAKGVAPDTARAAANLNAAQTFATQTALGMVGGKMLGAVGTAAGKVLGTEGGSLAAGVLGDLTGTSGALMPFLKQLPGSAAEAVGAGAVQAGLQGAIEQQAGIDDTGPWKAAVDSIVPMLGLTAVMSPLGLASRALGVRSAKMHTDTLSSADTAPEIRTQLADQYTAALAKADPQAAAAFRANAEVAIANKQGLPVDPRLFEPGAVQPPAPETPEAPTLALPAPTPRLGNLPAGQLYTFPDGSTTRDFADVESYLNGLPAEQQDAARAQIFGFEPNAAVRPSETPEAAQQVADSVDTIHQQLVGELEANGVTPAQPMTRQEFAEANGIGGQRAVQEYRAYLADPATQEAVMRENIARYEQLQEQRAAAPEAAPAGERPAVEPSTEGGAPERTNTQLGDALQSALRQQQVDRAYSDLAAQRESETAAIANRTKGEELAAAAERGEIQPDANAPKARADIVDDWKSAVESGGLDSNAQSRVPFEKRMDALGLDKMQSHQEQIDALQAAIDDPKAKMSDGVRDRMTMLLDKWKADAAENAPAPVTAKTPQAELPTLRNGDSMQFETKTGQHITISKELDLGGAAVPEWYVPGERDGARFVARDSTGKEIGTLRFTPGSKAIESEVDPAYRRQGIGTVLYDLAENHGAVLEGGERLGTVSDDAQALRASRAGRMSAEPPAHADALGDNIPTPAPDNAAPPAHTDTLGENIAPSVREQAQAAADKLDATLADFNARIRAGEQLSPLEQERYEDVQGLRQTLAAINAPTGGKHAEDFIRDVVGFARETESPYTKSQRVARAATPTAVDPALLAPAAQSGKLSDVLAHLAQNGSEPWVKTLSERLGALGLNTQIASNFLESRMAGRYSPVLDRIEINGGHESESTILHEAVHAATLTNLQRAASFETPRTQAEAQMKRALRELEYVRQSALRAPGAEHQYGLTDANEFVAELHSNPEFQQFLREQGTQKSLWQRAVDGVRRLLGLSVDDRTALEKAMLASDAFFGDAAKVQDFDRSPAEAAKVTDDTFHAKLVAYDQVKDKLDMNRMGIGLLRATLGGRTVENIADGVRAIPELVKSGFSKGLDAYEAAMTSRRLAAEHIEGQNGKFATGVQQLLNKLGDADKARDLSMQMMKLGGESSIGQFDYKLNFADNLKQHPDLDPRNKAYIDGIHREFTQLQRTNPEAAKALVDGEKLNRKMLVVKTATIIANLMDARAGVTRRLEAELARMSPDDAARAALEARVANARQEGQLAAIHSRGLDFMGKDLLSARNTKPDFHYDGAAATLAARVNAAFEAASKLPEGTPLRAHMAELQQMYAPQYRNPYFSLGRDGDFFVSIGFKPGVDAATMAKLQAALTGTNKVLGNLQGGHNHAFFRVETADQAAGLRRKLEAAAGNFLDTERTASGMVADRSMVHAAGVTPALRQMLASLHEEVDTNPALSAEQGDAMKAAVTRQLLSMLPETSSRSAQMQRRGVPGYDGDFVGNFARRASGAVQDISNVYTAPAFGAALKQMSDSITGLNRTGTEDAKLRAQSIADEINTRYQNGMNPVRGGAVNLINSLGRSFYLTLNPAFLIRTMAQPYHRGLPYLGSRYGMVSAAKEIGGATAAAMKIVANTIRTGWDENGMRGVLAAEMNLDGVKLTPTERAFLQEAHDRGVLKLGESQQLQRLAMGGGSQLKQDVVRFAAMNAQYAETINRIATGLAAYRLAEKGAAGVKQAGVEANTEYGIKAISRVMDNFDPDNTARWLSKQGPLGKVTPLMLSFMNYNFQTMQQLVRTVNDGMFNRDMSEAGQQRAREARREFAGLMATTVMISGAMGLPFANAFAGVYNMLTEDQDHPTDIRASARNFMADLLGQEGGAVAAHGLGQLIGADTSTFGLQDLLPFSEFIASRQLLKDRFESLSQQLLGPALNAGIDVALGLQKISDGYVVKGVEQMLPSGVKAPYKAIELATRGYTDSKGNPIPLQANGWDVALQGLGFRSAKKAEQSEASEDFSSTQNRLQYRRQIITDHLYKAVTAGDAGDRQDAIEAMQEFNQKNPFQPIRGVGEAMRTHLQGYAVGAVTGTGVQAGPRKIPVLQQQLRYAAMPEKP